MANSNNLNSSVRSIKNMSARGRDFPKLLHMRSAILVQGCKKSPSALNFLKTSRTNYPQCFRKHNKDQDRPSQQKLSKSVN